MDLSSKKANFISRSQAATDALLRAITELENLTQEGIGLNYVVPVGSTGAGVLTDADFSGTNTFLSATVFAQVYATLQQLDQQLHAIPTGGTAQNTQWAVLCQMRH